MAITVDNPHGYIFAERGSFEWNKAWQALMAVGHRPENFMLMHGEPKNGAVVWGFKYIDNREYVYVTVTESVESHHRDRLDIGAERAQTWK